MIRPAPPAATGREQVRQFRRRRVAQGDEINRLTPSGRFLGAARGDHLADHGRQHGGSVLPTNQVETLEGLVDEVERVSGVGEGAIRLSREQKVGEDGRRGTSRDGREHGALGRLPMAYGRPTPQPALEGGKIRRTRERRTLPARRFPFAVGRHAAGAVEQGEIILLLR